MFFASPESWLTETLAYAGRVCPFIPLPSLGEEDVSAMDPRAGSGQLPGRYLSVLDISAAAAGFFGG